MDNNAQPNLEEIVKNLKYAVEYMDITPEEIDEHIHAQNVDLYHNPFVYYKDTNAYKDASNNEQQSIDAAQQYMMNITNEFINQISLFVLV